MKADVLLDGSSSQTGFFWFISPSTSVNTDTGYVTGLLFRSTSGTQNAFQYQLMTCDYTGPTHVQAYFDGMAIGWGVVAAMVSALSILFIKKSFFR
jgi:hypothetical protein